MVYAKTTWVAAAAPCICSTYLNNLETQYDQIITIGEIKLYASSTAPENYLMCDGSSYPTASYAALFAVTSYKFGGSASTFRVPDMRGKFAVGYSGAGDYTMGNSGGTSGVQIYSSHMPALLSGGATEAMYRATPLNQASIESYSATPGAVHENRPPYIVLDYIIRYQ